MRIGFWGSSLVSAYWNGAATYYRGILRALAALGHQITFFEPDAYDRQKHRDIEDPEWARIVVYDPQNLSQVGQNLAACERLDVVVKASGVGVLDRFLEARVAGMPLPVCKVFWDVDAPATLERLALNADDPFHAALPRFDLVLTYGGGKRVTNEYQQIGARQCFAIYNALDPDIHHPVLPDSRFTCELSFLGNRLPDREVRVDEFFLKAAALSPGKRFLLGGSGWADKPVPSNVKYLGHVYTREHNAFNCSSLAVLNVSRESMARYGFSPATRVFEAAGAAACLITDEWEGIESFLQPATETLVARHGNDVARIIQELNADRARAIGEAARKRVLAEHTYEKRGNLLASIFEESVSGSRSLAMEMRA
ncbi:MAG TPA: glycosyltransferase [Bryobacteraceae bacterium]|jgi:spore maturation protein CgeB|nr:glycosyltransferase [Bryobacteraceae bacterium]